jgi:hypothetical protein
MAVLGSVASPGLSVLMLTICTELEGLGDVPSEKATAKSVEMDNWLTTPGIGVDVGETNDSKLPALSLPKLSGTRQFSQQYLGNLTKMSMTSAAFLLFFLSRTVMDAIITRNNNVCAVGIEERKT